MWKFKMYEKLGSGFLSKGQSQYFDLDVDIANESTLGTIANSMKPDELEKFFVTINVKPGEIFPLSKWLYIANASEIE
jgi:hypothetical protein